MNTNLIMSLLIQLMAALQPAPEPKTDIYIPALRSTNVFITTNLVTTNVLWWNYIGSDATNVSTEVSDEYLQKILKAGRLCKLLGHNWKDGREGEHSLAFLDYAPNIRYRHCTWCKLGQVKNTEDWK